MDDNREEPHQPQREEQHEARQQERHRRSLLLSPIELACVLVVIGILAP
jgi:hypothetical protein